MKKNCLLCASIIVLTAGFAGADVVDDINDAIRNFSAEEYETRAQALQTITDIGKAATEQLLKTLDADTATVRTYVCKALGNIGDRNARPGLEKALKNDASPAVRAAAAEAMGAFKADALDALRLAAAEDDDEYVRLSATISIASVRTKPAIDLLIWLLKSPGGEVKQLAADCLRDITLQDFGTDYENWRKWWLDNRDTFQITMQTYPYHPVEDEE
jgi:HEAT repeat protein